MTPGNDDGPILIPATPPKGLEGESQGGVTITLALGRHPPPPVSLTELPVSRAPPRLAGENFALGKRRRSVTKRYEEAREDGEMQSIGLSQK